MNNKERLELKFPPNAFRSRTSSKTVEVVNSQTKDAVYNISAFFGKATCGIVNQEASKVIFMSFDPHWYINPIVNIFDMGLQTNDSIITHHHPQNIWMEIAYDATSNLLFLGGVDGTLSVYDLQSRGLLWTFERDVFNYDNPIRCVGISSNGNFVCSVVGSKLSILSAKDGMRISEYKLKAEPIECGFNSQGKEAYVVYKTNEEQYFALSL